MASVGKTSHKLFGEALPKTLSISGLVLAAIAAALLIKTDFTLEGKAKLRPSVRQHVFAKLDGEVQQVLVEHDSPVKKGELSGRRAQPGFGQGIGNNSRAVAAIVGRY